MTDETTPKHFLQYKPKYLKSEEDLREGEMSVWSRTGSTAYIMKWGGRNT
jgi:hypothetical protein